MAAAGGADGADSSSDDERFQDSDDEGESDVEPEIPDTGAAPPAAAAIATGEGAFAGVAPAHTAGAGRLDDLPDLEMPARKRAATTAAVIVADDDDKGFFINMQRNPEMYKHIVVSQDQKYWSCNFCYPRAAKDDWELTHGKASKINAHIDTMKHQRSTEGLRQATLSFVPELDQAHFEALLMEALSPRFEYPTLVPLWRTPATPITPVQLAGEPTARPSLPAAATTTTPAATTAFTASW